MPKENVFTIKFEQSISQIITKATVSWNLVSAPPPASDTTPARILSLLSLLPLLHLHFKVSQLFVANFVVGLTNNTF